MQNRPCVRGDRGAFFFFQVHTSVLFFGFSRAGDISGSLEINTVVRVSGDTPVVVSQLACYAPREGVFVPIRTRNIIDLDGHMALLAWLRRLRRVPYTHVPDREFGEWQIRICISKRR